MSTLSKVFIATIVGISLVVAIIVTFHIGGPIALHIGQFAPLSGALIGGCLVLLHTDAPALFFTAKAEPLGGSERVAWRLIGIGMLAWGIGESIWRYYISINQSPFPSLADIGYSCFPLFVFVGLLMLPTANLQGRRFVLIMDCLITMGSILAIAWSLLLGSLAQAPTEPNLGKFLGLYYPISDTALLSCIIFLLLRGQASDAPQARARRFGLLVIGIGLCFFVTSDFIFNIQQNAGTYIEATWVDLGWPLGMITIAIGAHLRRYPPAISRHLGVAPGEQANIYALSPLQLLPYVLVLSLFVTLVVNVLSFDKGQQAIRPVLVIATLSVVFLIIARQIFTVWENAQLLKSRTEAFDRSQLANQQLAVQSQQMAQQNAELERGIDHLKGVHASLSNGNYRARAALTRGVLWPLAASVNLMAERWSHVAQDLQHTQRLRSALEQLTSIVERKAPILFMDMYDDLPEINRLITALSQPDEKSANNDPVKQSIPNVTSTKSQLLPPKLPSTKSQPLPPNVTSTKSQPLPPKLPSTKNQPLPPNVTSTKSQPLPPKLPSTKSQPLPPKLPSTKSQPLPPKLPRSSGLRNVRLTEE